MNVDDIIDILAIELLGVIPDDEAIVISTNKGEPVVTEENPLSAKALEIFAEGLPGKSRMAQSENGESKFSKLIKLLFSK